MKGVIMPQATQSTDPFQTTLATIMRVAKGLKNQTLPKKVAFRLVKTALQQRKSDDEQWIKEQILLESKLGNTIIHSSSKPQSDVRVTPPMARAKSAQKVHGAQSKTKTPGKAQVTPKAKSTPSKAKRAPKAPMSTSKGKNLPKGQESPRKKKKGKKNKRYTFKIYKEPFIQFNETLYKAFLEVFGKDSFDFLEKTLVDMHRLNPFWASRFMGTVQSLDYQIPDNIDAYTYITTHKEWNESGGVSYQAYLKAVHQRRKWLDRKWQEKKKDPSFKPRRP